MIFAYLSYMSTGTILV